MNRLHRWLCRSEHWRRELEIDVLPWVLEEASLGANVLELGPGPGLTTDILRSRVPHLTALEIDSSLAQSLGARTRASNVTVIQGDATALPFADAQFSAAVCFTMLHHVPSPALQDQLLREVQRVLQPGGTFMGVDSLTNTFMRFIHIFDTLVPIDPATFPARLQNAGFEQSFVETNPRRFRFRARKPCERRKGVN